ncbi:MAG: GPW/gp25 family protein [Gammaproteobacteria bacterium]|nr:GPW/gp25 family protein [Gammaproteobacteria bacterium]
MTARVAFPFRFDQRGHTRDVDQVTWVRGLIEQVLFTAPGERVMRPEFGTGLHQLVFAPNSPELAATTQFLVQGALQQWLGDLITVEAVAVQAEEGVLHVTVQYRLNRSGEQRRDVFSRGEVT